MYPNESNKKRKKKHTMRKINLFFEASWKRLTKSYTITQQTSEAPK
jgi:hypothetical protein